MHTGHAFDDGGEIGFALFRILVGGSFQDVAQSAKSPAGAGHVVLLTAVGVIVIGYGRRNGDGGRVGFRLRLSLVAASRRHDLM